MISPDSLRRVLLRDTADVWATLAPHLPSALYLAGGTAVAVHLRHRESRDLDFFFHHSAVDLTGLEDRLSRLGAFAVVERAPGTLNGVFSKTKVRFLHADEKSPQRLLEEPKEVAGIRVAGLGDLAAMKLKVIRERGELRDYFDMQTMDQSGGCSVEDGLACFLMRYHESAESDVFRQLVVALGYLEDVDDDLALPQTKNEIASYWHKRQGEVVRNLGRTATQPSGFEP